MACRIQSIPTPCGYNLEGLADIRLLDFEDFIGYEFADGVTYESCYVSEIRGVSDLAQIPTAITARYSSTLNNDIYTHVLETFVPDLSASLSATLHLASKRRFVVLFQSKTGSYHTFGYESGAALTYTNQTAEAKGSLVTLTAVSIHPLFEAANTIPTSPITGRIYITDDYIPADYIE